MASKHCKGDASIVLCGAAGQGIQTVEHLATRILKQSGYHVFSCSEFMSRIRGGTNSTEIRVSSKPVDAFVNRIDILFVFDPSALGHLGDRVSADTVIIGEREMIGETDHTIIEVAFADIASEIGNKIYANTVAAGVLAGVFGADMEAMEGFLRAFFGGRSKEIIDDNVQAAQRGYEIGQGIVEQDRLEIDIEPDAAATDWLIMNGSEAVGLGALAGGCDFISSYPMSPSTGVLVYLAKRSQDVDILVEQAEDEISALNMSLGASYAGARSMVTTSGGGFALMAEALSLAGVAELPVVIHLAQRPGPGTGMPTRTEQGDLLFALFAGHGEFPRVILAPGTARDGFFLTQQAFNMAAKHQVPAIVLTDQYFVDSNMSLSSLDTDGLTVERHVVEADEGYERYAITDSGVSPRGVPGWGEGLVVADSHEHGPEGHMTENFDVRIAVKDKRLRKLQGLVNDAIPPELIGPSDHETLIVGWGTTHAAIVEALAQVGSDRLAYLYCKQVYPLHPDIADHLARADKVVVVENNATGQFAKLLKLETGVVADETINKYNGMPFSVEELVDAFAALVED